MSYSVYGISSLIQSAHYSNLQNSNNGQFKNMPVVKIRWKLEDIWMFAKIEEMFTQTDTVGWFQISNARNSYQPQDFFVL